MVVADATVLLLLFRPGAGVPRDSSGKPIEHVRQRIEFLVSELERAKTKILIPTPALSELLIRAGPAAAAEIIEKINRQTVFRIEAFDTRAAIEVAAMLRDELPRGKKALKAGHETWAKLKFDRQIVAIAAVNQATTIYSDDEGVRSLAKRYHIEVIGLADLPLPPEGPEANLDLFERGPEIVL